jgi:ketosteroid isomerase-like protein
VTSEENVELVLAANDAYNAGEIDAMLRLYATDVEAIPDRSAFIEVEQLHGRQAFAEWVAEIGKAWDEVRWEIREAQAVGGDQVLVRGDWGGKGHGSGLEIASNFSAIFTVANGQITKVEYFADHGRALAAAGLAE